MCSMLEDNEYNKYNKQKDFKTSEFFYHVSFSILGSACLKTERAFVYLTSGNFLMKFQLLNCLLRYSLHQ